MQLFVYGKCVQPRFSNLVATVFATTVNTAGDALQGVLDPPQLATFNFHELRTNLVIRTIDGRIDIVAYRVQSENLRKLSRSPFECFTQGVASCHQPLTLILVRRLCGPLKHLLVSYFAFDVSVSRCRAAVIEVGAYPSRQIESNDRFNSN